MALVPYPRSRRQLTCSCCPPSRGAEGLHVVQIEQSDLKAKPTQLSVLSPEPVGMHLLTKANARRKMIQTAHLDHNDAILEISSFCCR